MSVDLDTTPESIARDLEVFKNDLDTLLSLKPEDRYADGYVSTLFGLDCVIRGLNPLARRFFEMAMPMLSDTLSPAGPPETETEFCPATPEEQQQIEADIPTEYRGKVTITSGAVRMGFDSLAKADRWESLALCRWLLERRHDAESYANAAGQMFRHYDKYPQYEAQGQFHDDVARLLCAAGEDRRLVDYFGNHPKFKVPTRHVQMNSGRKMAWMLATHRLTGQWSEEELDKAWSRFLKVNVPMWVNHGHKLALATWLKVRYWNLSPDRRPDPYEAFMRIYDHLPGITPPPIVR